MPDLIRGALLEFNNSTSLRKLAGITGYDDLESDPTLFGGGMHLSSPGSFLDVHVDFSTNPDTGHLRALTLRLYLPPDWDPAWGGYLEMWGTDGKMVAIQPKFNRAVLFETSEISWHGHPRPLACPPGVVRKSLAVYYYRPIPAKKHTTIYMMTPGEIKRRLDAREEFSLQIRGADGAVSTYHSSEIVLEEVER